MQTMIIIRFRRKSRLGQLTYFDPTLGHNGPGMQARYKESVVVPLLLLPFAPRLLAYIPMSVGTWDIPTQRFILRNFPSSRILHH